MEFMALRHGQGNGVRTGPVGKQRAHGRDRRLDLDKLLAVLFRHCHIPLAGGKHGDLPAVRVVERRGGRGQRLSLIAVRLGGAVNTRQCCGVLHRFIFPRHRVAQGLGGGR